MLRSAEDAEFRGFEHLRRALGENSRISAAPIEDAQLAESEHLRSDMSIFGNTQDSARRNSETCSPKMLM
jgi:hypothetical protein